VQGKRLEMGQGILGWVAEHGEPLLVPDTRTDSRYFGDFDAESGFSARSILCVPLLVKGQPIGAIEAINKLNGTFDEEDLRLLTRLAVPAATAIENAQLFSQSQQEITERKRAEEALEAERTQLARRVEERTADLRTANAELARAARMKDEFLASVSHELRTPLNAIIGFSELLYDGMISPSSPQYRTFIGHIQSSGKHLLQLINDVLDLSKVEAGKVVFAPELVDLGRLVSEVCASLGALASQKRVQLRIDHDESLVDVQLDPGRFKQILYNYLSNALKFSPDGAQVLVRTRTEVGGMFRLDVRDQGVGISQADQARLFMEFQQLEAGANKRHGGTGLGLALTKRLVEAQGGSVGVNSVVGQGSEFYAVLPRHVPSQPLND
jgi:signal transduction histidine kinase